MAASESNRQRLEAAISAMPCEDLQRVLTKAARLATTGQGLSEADQCLLIGRVPDVVHQTKDY